MSEGFYFPPNLGYLYRPTIFINAKRGCGWAANKWVWPVDFKVIEGGAR